MAPFRLSKKSFRRKQCAKSFRPPFSKGGGVEGRRPSSPSAEGERPDSSKDQEGSLNRPGDGSSVGNPIKGFPDAARNAAFGQLAIYQPVFRHAEGGMRKHGPCFQSLSRMAAASAYRAATGQMNHCFPVLAGRLFIHTAGSPSRRPAVFFCLRLFLRTQRTAGEYPDNRPLRRGGR